MAYFLVMGGLALSVLFTLAWGLYQAGHWLRRRLRPAPASARRRGRRKSSTTPGARGRQVSKRQGGASSPAPWRLTRGLARCRSTLPLGLLALLLYGGSRLAEHGLAYRAHEPPAGYHHLVDGLGWTAAVLLGLASLALLAGWRCRG
ncbi:hypothetical protein [Halomonas cerina]|uniref:Uncharacterized protein n=1 Tax=Halomonas cerina TaxID=447424 RepID=A0A839V8G1_9GAMM|nr:hypothetical protein [Halomonas cerina]MBB3188994.1 hypothetical protein [Halomonas cerina]